MTRWEFDLEAADEERAEAAAERLRGDGIEAVAGLSVNALLDLAAGWDGGNGDWRAILAAALLALRSDYQELSEREPAGEELVTLAEAEGRAISGLMKAALKGTAPLVASGVEPSELAAAAHRIAEAAIELHPGRVDDAVDGWLAHVCGECGAEVAARPRDVADYEGKGYRLCCPFCGEHVAREGGR